MFPLSNWTELDVWHYIHLENIPIVPLYFAKQRPMVVRGDLLIPVEHDIPAAARRKAADGHVPHALARLHAMHRRHPLGSRHRAQDHRGDDGFRRSERENRVIDHDQEGSMELKKREGYF